MRPTNDITVTISGALPLAGTYVLSADKAERLARYVSDLARDTGEPLSATAVLPELADDIQRPATILKGLRYRSGLTQKQLAEQLGIKQHHISEMESGKRAISKDMAKRLAAALNTQWKMLL